jgi:hypothetical protein
MQFFALVKISIQFSSVSQDLKPSSGCPEESAKEEYNKNQSIVLPFLILSFCNFSRLFFSVL